MDANGEITNRILCWKKQRFFNVVCFSTAIGDSNNLSGEGASLMSSVCHSVPISLEMCTPDGGGLLTMLPLHLLGLLGCSAGGAQGVNLGLLPMVKRLWPFCA